MQRYGLSIAILFVLFCGCRPEAPRVAYHAPAVSLADYEIGAPLVHGNLTIFPVTSKEARSEDRFITLDEGLKAGTVKVFEVGSEDGNDEHASADAQPNLPLNLNNDAPIIDLNDPRAALPRPPSADEEVEVRNEVEQPDSEATAAPQIAAQQLDQNPYEVEQLQVDAEGNFELSFTQGGFQGSERDVNRLMVVNTSDRPLYLMPGEVIIGGSQDRTIGQELVIAPGGEPVAVDVFCVEHERWEDREVEQTVMQLQAASQGILRGSVALEEDANANEAAAEIAKGKFVASVGNLNKSARLALQQSGDQGKVWDAVASQNSASKVAGGMATFTHNYSDAGFVAQLEPYVESLHDPVLERTNVVGVIVAVNGKVESMDMFESTPLFKKLWPKLLKSYALDAATQAANEESDAEPHPAVVTMADAKSFFSQATSGEVTKTDSSGDLAITARQTENVICFTSRQPLAEAEAAPAHAESADALGGATGVHVSAFAH